LKYPRKRGYLPAWYLICGIDDSYHFTRPDSLTHFARAPVLRDDLGDFYHLVMSWHDLADGVTG